MWGLAWAAAAGVPILWGGYALYLASEAVAWALAAGALSLLVGHVGLPSLGHAAFFGIGAYAVALVTRADGPVWAGLAVAAALAGAYALVTAPVVVRGHGVVVLMTSLAFSQIIYSIAYRWSWLTGGDDGLAVPERGLTPELFHLVAVAALGLAVLALRQLVASPFGKALEAIRQDEVKARALGIRVRAYKCAAYVLSGAITGLAGGLAALHREFVSPHDLYWSTSATLLVMVLLGGARGIYGSALGAVLYVLLQSWVSSLTDLWSMWLGLLLVAAVLWGREGIWGLVDRRRTDVSATGD